MSWNLEVSLKPDHNMLCVKKSPRQGPNRTRLPLKPAYHGHISWEEWKRRESIGYWLDDVGWPLLHLFPAQCSCKGSHRIYLNNPLMVQLNDALNLNVRFANRCDDCSENFEDSVPRRLLCATALPLQVRNDVAGMVIWQGGRPASANSWHHLTESGRELRLVETSRD